MFTWEMYKMKTLLNLARKTLEAHFQGKEVEVSKSIKKKFSEKKACFVTLTKNEELRGCIGSIYPRQALYKDIIENTLNAAFSDPRFPQLGKEELNEIKIEISVLTIPEKLEFKNREDLLKKLTKKEGLIIKKGFYSATYLPQVWRQMPDKQEFLSTLCMKAGLNCNAWREKGIEVFAYKVEAVEE